MSVYCGFNCAVFQICSFIDRNLEQKKDWKNQKLLGNDLKFSARDLINVYVELEKEFDIHFKEKDIVAGKFDTFDDIIKLINKEIAYKTRGKEHA